MNRHQLKRLKKEEFISQLKEVKKEDWVNMKPGTLLFHKNSTEIIFVDRFIEYSEGTVFYTNSEGTDYNYCDVGWYFYDLDVLDTVVDNHTQRLFQHKEDLVVANRRNLVKKFEEVIEGVTESKIEELLKKGEIKEIREVSGFDILIQH